MEKNQRKRLSKVERERGGQAERIETGRWRD